MDKIKEITGKINPVIAAAAAAITVSAICANFSVFARDAENLRGEVIRLHILANSDSAEDQQLKLALRDELLEKIVIPVGAKRDDTLRLIEERLPQIEDVSRSFLKQAGCDLPVHAEITNMYFNTREYGGGESAFRMPAGDYDALRLTIGAGAGHNWWCVLYPPLCLPAAADKTSAGGKTSADSKSLNKSPQKLDMYFSKRVSRELTAKPKIKFAVYELLCKKKKNYS
ncbi:stage II sporulation protein R [Clostridia bacterium]|nr:stage II sporulation protein R [Clostridia bacterium]